MRQLILMIVLCAAAPLAPAATLDKGHRLLVEHGFQIQGMASKDDVFHRDTYFDAGYTAVNWIWEANLAHHGPAPGVPWARWVGDPSQMPPVGGEGPYMDKLLALSLGDEKNLNDPAVREPYIQWFNSVRASYPNTILYANNFGGQVNDAALGDFITRGQPDMICFDTYPWRSDYTTRQPAPPPGGSPTAWYGDLRRYREHARQNNIPLATYRQSFHAVQDYDHMVYRDPSPSEFRLNSFASMAFNVKFLIDFTYNTGASSYFTAPGGDSNPTALYHEMKQVNKEVRNLGKSLVHLKPIDDVATPDQRTTGIQILRGRHDTGADTSAPNELPVGFSPDPQAPNSYSDWESNRNDPYLRGWNVSNTGTRNSGLPGDVMISWFKLMDESADGDAWTDEIYMMVTNGLSDAAGSGVDTRQQIKLNFLNAADTQVIQRLNRETGLVDEVDLPLVSTRRQLVLDLDGGTSELFKFKTGAPFVGVTPIPEPAAAAVLLPLAVLAMRRRAPLSRAASSPAACISSSRRSPWGR